MFVLSVIDNNGYKIDLLKYKSQKDLDSFTTCFEKSDFLLEQLGLDESFEIEISEYLKKDDEPTILPFTGSKYRNVIYDYNSYDYLKSISSLDRNILKSFFYNELLFQKEKNAKFSENKQKNINKILELFNQSDKNYRGKLVDLLSSYFKNYYSAFKKFYKYVINFTKKEDLIYPTGTKQKCLDEIERMKTIISERKKIVEEVSDYEDELDSISVNPLSDIDDKVSELDMFLDDKNVSFEEKQKIIDKKIRKL